MAILFVTETASVNITSRLAGLFVALSTSPVQVIKLR
jgi:hypothetical protein